MQLRTLKADLILLLTAAIWGVAFVAQRAGMDHVGPLTFNGIRFALGALALTPLVLRAVKPTGEPVPAEGRPSFMFYLGAGGFAGLVLFAGATLQQVGLMTTTAGKAGFITGLYVIIVPLLGLFFQQRTGLSTWIGASMAVVGMYLLSVTGGPGSPDGTGGFSMAFGDVLVLLCAICFAIHVLVIGYLSPRCSGVVLSCAQFAWCAALSLVYALIYEPISLEGVRAAAIPILYGGLMSVGVAYTLQVIAQRDAHPSHAAVLLSLESVFAAVAGYLLLGELLTLRGLIGCGLMLAGMLVSQLKR